MSGYNVSSTGGDALTSTITVSNNNGMMFSTRDNDNDLIDGNCANTTNGGWWWADCGGSRPTGSYLTGGQVNESGVNWYYSKNNYYSFKIMKFTLTVVPTVFTFP